MEKYNGMTKTEAIALIVGVPKSAKDGKFNEKRYIKGLNKKYGGEATAYETASKLLCDIGLTLDFSDDLDDPYQEMLIRRVMHRDNLPRVEAENLVNESYQAFTENPDNAENILKKYHGNEHKIFFELFSADYSEENQEEY